MFLGFFTYKILSNETVDPYLKYFTFSMLLITLKWTFFSCVIHKYAIKLFALDSFLDEH